MFLQVAGTGGLDVRSSASIAPLYRELPGMLSLFASVLWAGCCFSESPVEPLQVGYLCQPAYCLDECIRTPLEPYFPQAGDIVLFTDDTILWKVGFHLAGTGHPYHSGIIVALPEGGFGSLEAGFNDT